MLYKFVKQSNNSKTGKIPVSITGKESCPTVCPLKGAGCYAAYGPMAIHWKATTEHGESFRDFLKHVKALPANQLWRHNTAGDLPGTGNVINAMQLNALVESNEGKRGFTYTHKPVLGFTNNAIRNSYIIAMANKRGFTINLSANNMAQADKLSDLNIAPVVVLLPKDAPKKSVTPKGRIVAQCPATYLDNVTCESCGLCQKINRKVIVGFPAHGVGKNMANSLSLAA